MVVRIDLTSFISKSYAEMKEVVENCTMGLFPDNYYEILWVFEHYLDLIMIEKYYLTS